MELPKYQGPKLISIMNVKVSKRMSVCKFLINACYFFIDKQTHIFYNSISSQSTYTSKARFKIIHKDTLIQNNIIE